MVSYKLPVTPLVEGSCRRVPNMLFVIEEFAEGVDGKYYTHILYIEGVRVL